MSTLFTLPQQVPLTTSAGLYPGAKANFYITQTSTRKSVYTDSGLVTPHSNPVVADANGVFPPIWLADDEAYRVTLTTSADAVLTGYPVDGVGGGAASQLSIGQALFPVTDAENTAGVAPSNQEIPSSDAVGIVLAARYGFSPDASGATNYAAVVNAHAVAVAAGCAFSTPSGAYSFAPSATLVLTQNWFNVGMTRLNINMTAFSGVEIGRAHV